MEDQAKEAGEGQMLLLPPDEEIEVLHDDDVDANEDDEDEEAEARETDEAVEDDETFLDNILDADW